jgi:hypothetical protein
MEEERNKHRILVGKSFTNLFDRPRRRWEDNIKTYLRQMRWMKPSHNHVQWQALMLRGVETLGSVTIELTVHPLPDCHCCIAAVKSCVDPVETISIQIIYIYIYIYLYNIEIVGMYVCMYVRL